MAAAGHYEGELESEIRAFWLLLMWLTPLTLAVFGVSWLLYKAFGQEWLWLNWVYAILYVTVAITLGSRVPWE